MAQQYLRIATGIDIPNHVSFSGLEDVWSIKDYIHQQFAGIAGFSFSNTFLEATYFTQNSQNDSIGKAHHVNFKIKLANQLVSFKLANERSLSASKVDMRSGHKLISLGLKNQGCCYYCRHK